MPGLFRNAFTILPSQVILAAYGEDFLTYQSLEQIVDECRVEGEEMMREIARTNRSDGDARSEAAWSEASERLSRLEGQVSLHVACSTRIPFKNT